MAAGQRWKDKLEAAAKDVWDKGEGDVVFKVRNDTGYRRWEIDVRRVDRGKEKKMKKLDIS